MQKAIDIKLTKADLMTILSAMHIGIENGLLIKQTLLNKLEKAYFGKAVLKGTPK